MPDVALAQSLQMESHQGFQPQASSRPLCTGIPVWTPQLFWCRPPAPPALCLCSTFYPELCHQPLGTISRAQGDEQSQETAAGTGCWPWLQCGRYFWAFVWGGPHHHHPHEAELPTSLILPAFLS